MSSKLSKREQRTDSNSPGVKRTVRINTAEELNGSRAASGNMGSRGGNNASSGHLSNIGDSILGEDSLSLLTKLSRLEKDLERRKASYAAREDAYKERVAALEEELSNQQHGINVESTSWKKADYKLNELKSIQSEILDSVELVQDRTARIMQEQERDLLRSFRARLFDVQTELEKEKSKKDDGLAAWRERYTQLEAELDWAAEVSNRLDKVNHTLTQENNELKMKYSSQEQDRNLFIELLVSLKKDNSLWRSKNTDLFNENEKLKTEVRKLSKNPMRSS
jgi:DNA repair exonuclease SbcCD ATPase subunit